MPTQLTSIIMSFRLAYYHDIEPTTLYTGMELRNVTIPSTGTLVGSTLLSPFSIVKFQLETTITQDAVYHSEPYILDPNTV